MKIKYVVRDACSILFYSFDKQWAYGVCHGYNHYCSVPGDTAPDRYYVREERVADDHKIYNFDLNKGSPCYGSFKNKTL